MRNIVDALVEEQAELDWFLGRLNEAQWDLMTPAEGWTIKDSVAHLAFIDEVAAHVLRGDESPLKEAQGISTGYNQIGVEKGRSKSGLEVLDWWREAREEAVDLLKRVDPKTRLPWFARPMSPQSFATARLMETWAHGLDCYNALGMEPQDTDRLRNVAHLAYLAIPYDFALHGMQPPSSPIRLELVSPSGQIWSWGPEDAPDRIEGTAGDFCRVAVRRKHWEDTGLKPTGATARIYLSIAQAYAGPPGTGRRPAKKRGNHPEDG